MRQLRASSGAWPWEWTPTHFEAWSAAHLHDGRTKATLRGYQNAIVAFCAFIADSRYRWGEVCERLFGSVPARVTHELNLIRYKGDYEGRPEGNRPLTRAEQDRFFTVVNQRAEAATRLHRKGAAAAHRDAIMFLIMWGWGTRRTETAGVDVDDFRRNAKTSQFGRYGVLVVRNAKSFPMPLVQDQLGHTHVATTAVYRVVRRLQAPGALPEPRHGLGRAGGSGAVNGLGFEWKLRELMAMRQMFNTSDLITPPAERGIELSRSQVYRLVAETPERVTIPLLLALCDILSCQLTALAVPVEAPTRPAKKARKKAVGETAPLPPSAVPPSFFNRS